MYHLPKDLFIEIKKHARETFPEECCGFILYDVEDARPYVPLNGLDRGDDDDEWHPSVFRIYDSLLSE